MTDFTWLALLLSIGAMAFVLLPLLGSKTVTSAQRNEANVEAYQARLTELQSDFEAGEYTEEELKRLTVELQRRLLEEANGKQQAQAKNGMRWSFWLLAALIPVVALGIYQKIGYEQDLLIGETVKGLNQQHSNDPETHDPEAQKALMQQLVVQLKQRLEDDPSAQDYWVLLGRTQLELGDYKAAADSFRQLVALMPDDSTALSHYAQALYLSFGREITADVQQAIDATLAVDPHQPTILGLLGIHYYHHQQWQLALDYWQRLLVVLPPGSANANMIASAVEELKLKLGQKGSPSPAVSLYVSLAEGMDAENEAPVFVFARAVNSEMKMPVAVVKMKVADLPAKVVLDDSTSMTPSIKLSSFDAVEVIARVAKSGVANISKGDLQGHIQKLDVQIDPPVTSLIIDQTLP